MGKLVKVVVGLALLTAACSTAGPSDSRRGSSSLDEGDPASADRSGPGSEQPLEPSAGDDLTVWPNSVSRANSDPWIAEHHDSLRQMRPRFLVLNFANGIGESGDDRVVPGSRPTQAELEAKAQEFLDQLSLASRFHARTNPTAPAFLAPVLGKVVDLSDDGAHANSQAFPRGAAIPDTPGYRTVGYNQLFSQAFASSLGGKTLGQLVDEGEVHDVILMANQVDGRSPNAPDQVTSNILEVAFVAQAYDASFAKLPGEYVKNGIPSERQKADMAFPTAADHNSMPWTGRSLRIYFLNYGRGTGCLMHSLGHELEFRFNESQIHSPGQPYDGSSPHPFMQPYFRRFAGFDLKRFGAPFASLYAGEDAYAYVSCETDGCSSLNYRMGTKIGTISGYRAGCGNVHYPPGASHGYDYEPSASVPTFCESFAEPTETVVSSATLHSYWSSLGVNDDCGGRFLTAWFQNMPGLDNAAVTSEGAPMKNWWPFFYY